MYQYLACISMHLIRFVKCTRADKWPHRVCVNHDWTEDVHWRQLNSTLAIAHRHLDRRFAVFDHLQINQKWIIDYWINQRQYLTLSYPMLICDEQHIAMAPRPVTIFRIHDPSIVEWWFCFSILTWAFAQHLMISIIEKEIKRERSKKKNL